MDTPIFTSEEVLAHYAQVALVNDFYNGIDTANKHLKRYEVESTESYNTRIELSALNNYTKRAVNSIRDMITRKPIDDSELQSSVLSPFIETIDFSDNLVSFVNQLIINAAKDGFTFILVDKSPYDETIETKADESGLRPYLVNITRSQVKNWKLNANGTYKVFTFDEFYTVENRYSSISKVQQRVYLEDGTIEIWRGKKLYETIENGLGYIPIIKIGIDDIPPFYDLAKINKRHFNQDSSGANYVRACGSPFTQAFMMSNQSGAIKVGAMNGISFNESKSDAGIEWVELSGKNFEIIETVIKRDEETMRMYLAEIISNDTQKTATEVGMMNAGNESKLSYYAEIVEAGINKALTYMADYQGVANFDAKIYISRDFYNKTLTDAQIREYKGLFVDGVISWEKLTQLLIDGEVLSAMSDNEMITEKARLSDAV